MSAAAPVIIAISGHGRTIGVNPAARAKATHSPPRTRPEMAAEAATAANVSASDSAAMIQAI